ncbi:hypothetical protein H8356DRAFT_1339221 [Neocallimastix lanati (nom. inval.)]|nr:hypothetical protein H8356DRAFT_1339221 [Neocallimastix sp. JGI-2020a]
MSQRESIRKCYDYLCVPMASSLLVSPLKLSDSHWILCRTVLTYKDIIKDIPYIPLYMTGFFSDFLNHHLGRNNYTNILLQQANTSLIYKKKHPESIKIDPFRRWSQVQPETSCDQDKNWKSNIDNN